MVERIAYCRDASQQRVGMLASPAGSTSDTLPAAANFLRAWLKSNSADGGQRGAPGRDG